ncbi:XapX domain-containing protein [Streptomyces sp. Tu 3180]|nr:XapX domain-containing protein [Streptomyces sp. Tu 3180]
MGALYWALDLTSPAPPLIGLTGLAGIVLGERAATAVRDRLARRPAPPPPTAEQGSTRVP